MYPSEIITREIKVGPAYDLVSGKPLAVRVMIEPSRILVWGGVPVLPRLSVHTFKPGEEGRIELPVTDQEGYHDTHGNIIDVEDGEYTHYYKISTYYLRGGSVASADAPLKTALPEGDGSVVDIDSLVSFDAGKAAGILSVPDSWSADVEAAQAAAQAALDAVAGLDGNIDQAVTEWFEAHPDAVVSPTSLEAAIEAHKEEPTPHKAYDLDMPSLTVLFENGLV